MALEWEPIGWGQYRAWYRGRAVYGVVQDGRLLTVLR